MRRRRLSPDERALWKRATRDVRRAADAPALPEGGTPSGEPAPLAPHPARPVAGRIAAAPPSPPRRIKKTLQPSPFEAGDPALDRRVRRGRLRPERTLDLHGLTQAAARVRLESFLAAAFRDGLRCVLVITGKGAPGGAAERHPDTEQSPRGVLRRRFQEWLAEEPLRALVTRAAQASPADGGRGAFYVFLKAGRR